MLSNPKKAATRSRIKIGNIFEVELGDGTKKYFQYVANDLTQLNSRVIRAFKHAYNTDEEIDFNKMVKDKIEFYAHVFLPIGVKLGCWKKTGHVADVGRVDVYFRNSSDYGNPHVKRSDNWYVWKINEPFVDIGKLEGKYREAEIGVVVSPHNIVHRIKTGKYDFVYPDY